MEPDDPIIALNPDNREHVVAAARLHAQLLGHSPIARLGLPFMTRFYYSRLVRDGLIACDFYVHQGEYAGFIVYTDSPSTFMEEGRRRHFLFLAALLVWCFALWPPRLRTILQAMKITRRREPAEDEGRTGELLSFGVLPAHRQARDPRTGLRISNVLFEHAIATFRDRGFARFRWNLERDNKAAMLFYLSYGATAEESQAAWPSDYRLTLNLGP